MTTRRNFIKTSAFASAALFVKQAEAKENKSQPLSGVSKAIVLSTWNFGLKANEGAWTVLSKNGKALDAVEAGVRITEADPEERSVGYGGRPDRDGKVTLDACIMDEN